MKPDFSRPAGRRPLSAKRFAAAAAAWLLAGQAQAQLMLPGATGPSAPGAPQAAPAAPPTSAVRAGPPAPAPVRLVGEETLAGKSLFLNGTRGRLSVEKAERGSLRVQLIASGEKISKPTEACGLEFGDGQPVEARPVGRPDGMIRLKLDFPACPITLDVLDGAVLAAGVPAACRFQEADCTVDPRGLWGPAPSQLATQARAIETDRSIADKTVRQNFKALLARTHGRQEIKALASEQAGFTSQRETLCRDYAREAAHGFCATRYTEWRAASLAARLNRLDGKPEEALVAAAKPKPRPKPATSADAGPPQSEAVLAPAPAPVPMPSRAPAQPNFFERLFR